MANINKFKIGNKDPNKIMFKDVKYPDSIFKYNFNEWINTDNAEMQITENKVIITKFKPNVLLLHSPNPLKGTNCSEVCDYCRGNIISVTGLEANANIFNSYFKTTTTTGAGNDVGKCRGLCFYPFSTDGLFFTVHLNYWDHLGIDKEGNATLPQLPNMAFTGGLRLDGGGRNQYGLFSSDKTNKLIFPDELYGFNNTQNYSYYYGFGLFTGDTSFADESGYIDISENPITIELFDFGLDLNGVDPSSKECWDMYVKDVQIYHKDKTVRNCWQEYKLFKDNGTYYSIVNLNENIKDIHLPEVIDYWDYLWNRDKPLCFNIAIKNKEFWDVVRNYYEGRDITENMLHVPLFSNSNFDKDITLIIDIKDNYGYAYSYLFSDGTIFANSDIDTVTLKTNIGCIFTSSHNLFKLAGKLKTINVDTPVEYLCGATDCSGMFAQCYSLQTYPNKLINWAANRSNIKDNGILCTTIGWMFDWCGELVEVPDYDIEDRFSNNNTIMVARFAPQAFNGCNKLTYIGPVLDMNLVQPTDANDDPIQDVYNIFNCPNLVDVRIKNLNHGTWRLDGSGNVGNLPNLNKESIEYLFANLRDLNDYNPEHHDDNINKSFRDWDSNYKTPNDTAEVWSGGFKVYQKANNSEDAPYIVSTNKEITQMVIYIREIYEGDIVEFGSQTFNTGGQFIITNQEGNLAGFKVYSSNPNNTNPIRIEIINGVDYTNPRHNTAELWIPYNWVTSNYVTTTMMNEALNKGWQIMYSNNN